MRRLFCFVFCVVTVSLCACGTGENSSSGGAGSYLGSYITPNPAGGTAACSNYYGPANLKSALASTFNRTTPCPSELALGACEVPTGTGATAMQFEMVYYEQINSQGKRISTSYDNLQNGDPCNANGVWRKPYATTPPASVSSISKGGAQQVAGSTTGGTCTPLSSTTANGKDCPSAEACRREKCAAEFAECYGAGFEGGDYTGAACEEYLTIMASCGCDTKCLAEKSYDAADAYKGACLACSSNKLMPCTSKKCQQELHACAGS